MATTTRAALALAVVGGPSFAAEPSAATAADRTARTLLVERCGGCHGGADPSGGLDLGPLIEGGGSRKAWRRVRERIESGEMPPADEVPLVAAERAALAAWVTRRLAAPAVGPADPGPALVRRLSRDEYARTLRDLVGLEFDAAAAAGIADDAQGHGFANRVDVLGLSPALMEKYFAAAEAVLDRVMAAEPAPAPPVAVTAPARAGLVVRYRCTGPKPDDNQIRATLQVVNLGGTAVPLTDLTVRYWFTAEGRDAFQQWCDYAAVDARHVAIAVRKLDAPVAGADAFVEVGFAAGTIPPGGSSGDVQFRVAASDWSALDQADDHSFDPAADGLVDAPRITLHRAGRLVWGTEPAGPPVPRRPAAAPPGPDAVRAWERIFFARPSAGVAPRVAAGRVIEAFAARAWRRPVSPGDVRDLLEIWQRATAEGADFEAALRPALLAVLVSPRFLLRLERDEPATPTAPYRLVDDDELAVRLSYFVWSSMPDEQLAAAAAAGRLSNPAELERQVRRLLADPRAAALTESFAAPWLQLGKLATARPTPEFFPAFTPELRRSMLTEATTFLDNLRREDRSLLDLLDADYTFVDEPLARHYGLPGVAGSEFRRVNLRPEDHRGGVLGMAAVLTATSHTFRTSPTLRGRYVLEVLLGDPPPPPPANAGVLQNEREDAPPDTFRQSLVRHSRDPACAACHARIDPLGFGLEHYDGIGRWRDAAAEGIDASGRLPGGVAFTGPEELKRVLLARKSVFLRNASAQMLSFALGRRLEDCDEAAVDAIAAAVERDDGRFSTLVVEVANSFPFRHRRNAAAVRPAPAADDDGAADGPPARRDEVTR